MPLAAERGQVGAYGDAQYLPMLHASALDATRQRLYVDVATGANVPALGVVDLTGAEPLRVFPEEATPDAHDLLVGMHFDAATGRLVGVLGGAGAPLSLHTFDTRSQTWAAGRLISGVPPGWNTEGGNSGVVSTLDAVRSDRTHRTAQLPPKPPKMGHTFIFACLGGPGHLALYVARV